MSWINEALKWFQSPMAVVVMIVFVGVAMMLLGILWEIYAKKANLFQYEVEKKKKLREYYSDVVNKIGFIRRAEEELDRRLAILHVNFTARDITDIRILCIVVAFIISVLMSNILLFFPMAILAWNVPYSVVERRVQKRMSLFESQLLGALKVFLVEFSTLKNAQQAFVRVAPKIGYPLRFEFEYIARRLNSGEDPRVVLKDFGDRTQNPWAQLFAQLMIFHFEEGANVEGQILTIMDKLSSYQILRDKNRTEVSTVRNINLFLNALIPLTYLTGRILNPDASMVYVTTPTGRMILVGVAFLSVFSLYIGKRLTEA